MGRENAIQLLRQMQDRLCAAGETRLPRRGDFSDSEVCLIKAHLGPWPRALEAAGLKPPRSDGQAQRRPEKRIRQKRRCTEVRRAAAQNRKGEDQS